MRTNAQLAIVVIVGFVAATMFTPSTSQAAVLDLETLGSSGTINGAQFIQGAPPTPAGSGVLDSFVRIQGKDIEKGYNTDGTLEFDTKAGPTFTHAIQVKDIAETIVGGVSYRSFILDINQAANTPLLSLDSVKISLASTGNLTGWPVGNVVYDMGDNTVRLNYALDVSGSGRSDMSMLVPSALFGGDDTQYVYLYSEFGGYLREDKSYPYGATDGYEEWAVAKAGGTPPTSVPLTILKFLDTDGNGVLDGSEQALGDGWKFEISGGDLQSVVPLTTDISGLATWELTDGLTYLVTEVDIPSGWTQTTNAGNPISVTVSGPTSLNIGNIPEPATLTLLVLGGLVALARRRRA